MDSGWVVEEALSGVTLCRATPPSRSRSRAHSARWRDSGVTGGPGCVEGCTGCTAVALAITTPPTAYEYPLLVNKLAFEQFKVKR